MRINVVRLWGLCNNHKNTNNNLHKIRLASRRNVVNIQHDFCYTVRNQACCLHNRHNIILYALPTETFNRFSMIFNSYPSAIRANLQCSMKLCTVHVLYVQCTYELCHQLVRTVLHVYIVQYCTWFHRISCFLFRTSVIRLPLIQLQAKEVKQADRMRLAEWSNQRNRESDLYRIFLLGNQKCARIWLSFGMLRPTATGFHESFHLSHQKKKTNVVQIVGSMNSRYISREANHVHGATSLSFSSSALDYDIYDQHKSACS